MDSPVAFKDCARCKLPKAIDLFKPDSRMRCGRRSWCTPCCREAGAAYARAARASDPIAHERENESKRQARRAADPGLIERDAAKAAAREARQRAQAARIQAAQARLADCATHVAAYRRHQARRLAPGNPYERAKSAYRRARRKGRLARWCRIRDTLPFYEQAAFLERITGLPWHVDHIEPLRGLEVSGLHCPANLQVIPALVNQAKSNTRAEPIGLLVKETA